MAEGFNKEVFAGSGMCDKIHKTSSARVRHISALEATKKTLLLPMRSLASEIAAPRHC